mgnify:CR=1 FL=1
MAGRVRWSNVVTVSSAAILVGTESVATGVAAGWALGGLFRLGDIGEYVLMGVLGLIGLYFAWLYFRKATIAEPLTET